MTTIKEMKYKERKEFSELMANWLRKYTGVVIKQVMKRADEIAGNETAMMLLRELKVREDKEESDLTQDFNFMMMMIANGGEISDDHYDLIHSHILTHSKSYRDILYDMYIRDTSTKE